MSVSVLNGLFLVTLTVIAVATSQDDENKILVPNIKENSTTTENPTTTEEPSTTKHTTPTENTTTTAATTVTTTHGSTTTMPAPGPVGPGKWNVTNEQDRVCIILHAEIGMLFDYENASASDPDKKIIHNQLVGVPIIAVARGNCGKTESEITLTFYDDWELTLRFNLTGSKYEMDQVKLKYVIKPGMLFPNATEEQVKAVSQSQNLFATDEEKSYKCTAKEVIYSKNLNGTKTGPVEINVQQLQVQAFINTTASEFTGGVSHCSQDNVSQLVPIIVGATLAGLIIVVLIAYLIGRRRSRRGYESV